MHFQKFVAWEKLPSLLPNNDDSSSSASHSGSSGDDEVDDFDKYKNSIPKVESCTPNIDVPSSVKNVLIKLDTAQLERAKKEISKKLFRILDKVHRAYEHYKKEDFDPKLEKEYLLTPTWQEKNRRSRFMDEVDDALDDSVLKVHELEMVLQSLRTWHEMLTKIEKEDIRTAAPVDEMGDRLLKFIDYIDTNIQRLFKICSSFSEHKTKHRRKSVARAPLFKQWKEKVTENPKEGEPLTPEEMLENEPLAAVRSQEVTSLIQELADSSLFQKAEAPAIKYILNMVLNLLKAFAILTRQCRSLKVKCENLEILEKKKPDPQISQLQRELRMAMERKAALEMQVQTVEEKCKVLLTTNEVLQKELRDTHEKAALTKGTFIRPSSEKAVTKPQVDSSRKKDEKPMSKVPSEQRSARPVKSEDKQRLEEIPEQGPKPEDSVKEKLPVIPEAEVLQEYLVAQAQETRMKEDTKPQGKDTSSKQVMAKISSPKLQAKVSRKDLALKISEEIASDAAVTTTGDMKSLGTEPAQDGPAEKAHGPADKMKAAQETKGDSKLEERKKQKLLKRPRRSKEKDLVSPRLLDESPSPRMYEASSEEELSRSTSREIAHVPSGIEVSEPPKTDLPPLPKQPEEPAVPPPSIQEDGAILKPEQPVAAPPPSIEEDGTVLKEKPEQPVAAPPPSIQEGGAILKEKPEQPVAAPPPSIQEGGAILKEKPEQPVAAPPPSIQEGGAILKEKPEQPIAAPPPSIPESETILKDKPSQTTVLEETIEAMRDKKAVTFQDVVLVESPLTAPDTVEIRDAEVPGTSLSQQPILERTRDTTIAKQDAAEIQAQGSPMGKPKEIQEKKEIKGFSRMLVDLLQRKPLERTGSVIRGLGTKLQELAREKGGVLDADTIKEFFEQQDIALLETMPGPLSESQPGEKIVPQLPLAKRPPMSLFAVVQAARREKAKLITAEEEPLKEDVGIALHEFQAAILSSLADKMAKLKKGSSYTGKRPAKFQPTDPQVVHVFKVIDRKLEECFSFMKQRSLLSLKRQKILESTSSKGAMPEKEGKTMKATASASFDLSHRLSEASSSSSLSLSGESDQSLHSLHSKRWKQPSHEPEKEPVPRRSVREKLQAQQEDESKQPGEVLSSDEEEDEQFVASYLPDDVDEEELEYPEWQEEEHREEAGLFFKAEGKKPIPKAKDVPPRETKSVDVQVLLQELDEEERTVYMQLEERLLEEHVRLLGERQRLEEEAQYLGNMQGLFELQQSQWEEQQQQRKDQEQLWQVQLAHWQELQQQQEAQERHWVLQREKQKEQQTQMKVEMERMERLYKEHLQRQGEQAKEEWQWEQLKAMHREQQRLWQAEDLEQATKKWEWQQQLADHEERMETLQQDYREQEHKQKVWLEEQQEAQKEQERLWEKRWLGQMKRWRHQLQQQRAQQRNLLTMLEKGRKLQEKQPMRPVVKEETLLPRMVKMVQGTALEQIPVHQKIVLLRRDTQTPATPELSPKPSTEFEDSSYDLDSAWFPKLLPKAEVLPAPVITEKRYWTDVKAQRKNLELLKEALEKSELSLDEYNKAKGMIKQALQSDVERLALLFRKYIVFRHLQDIRIKLTAQLDIAKYTKDGAKMKELYNTIEKLDAYYKVVLGRWTVKQIAVEKKHQRCLEKMIAAFAQLRVLNKLALISPCPLLIKAADTTKGIISMPHIGSVLMKSKIYPSPLITVKKPQDIPYSAAVREPSSEQIETLWKTDITELSVPVGPKTPVSLLWSEACGYPDIPRLLELDISSVRSKPLQDIKTRIQNIPRWKVTGYNFMHL